ncbi:MAG: M20 family metallopeptidase [Gammaproteobacteria bacterium]|nr:M20 family metallopeptidase [Gammaproteobacteria bacterium]
MNFDISQAQVFIDQKWDEEIIPELVEYIKIPCKSPHFDPDWQDHGYMEQAIQQIAAWCEAQNIQGKTLEIVRIQGRTPVIFMEIPASDGSNNPDDDTILMYGHMDKQPEMVGWEEGLGPWSPVIKNDKLYGRGGADDGYAAYASLTALMALKRQDLPHARTVVLIEACEESGSYDLPYYIDQLRDRIGEPSLVICLDSGAGNYEQLWCTMSLRGLASGTLKVDVLHEGIHSGYGSGVVPSSFRIIRQLLTRLEDEKSGRLLPKEFFAEIPHQRMEQTLEVTKVLGDSIVEAYPLKDDTEPMAENHFERLLNRNWRPALSYTGISGMPEIKDAGNVLRPTTSVKLSLRLPPTANSEKVTNKLSEILLQDPPSNARVTFEADQSADGWNAPDVHQWLADSLEKGSQAVYNKPAMYMGEGGTIPFMAMLGEKFPKAQFMITGVLGPNSNAHGPNEFLHIPFAKKLTTCVSQVIVDHFNRKH